MSPNKRYTVESRILGVVDAYTGLPLRPDVADEDAYREGRALAEKAMSDGLSISQALALANTPQSVGRT